MKMMERNLPKGAGKKYTFYCPGCDSYHSYDIRNDGGSPNWQFNNSLESPTFTPSLFYPEKICHLYITDGKIHYLNDCTHKYSGLVIDMIEEDFGNQVV